MGARGRTTADGSVVLNLHRGAGAYALLARTDGQLTRAGQHYYSHLGLRPPTKDFENNQPLIREGPNDYILLRNGQKKLVRSLEGDGEHRLTKLGRPSSESAAYERKDWLPINELGGAMTRHSPRSRWRSACGGGWRPPSGDPAGPILQLSVRLALGSVHLSLRHLYVGASRATSSDLLEVA